ncbi:MAG: glutathione S-transferase [Myxococcales bacterium]|nr:glutathione S-transferase [Myxococcales bacterium]
MPKLKLSYFDFHGGRGEPARLALHIADVAFEDHRVRGPEFRELKPELPYGSLPVLEIDGIIVAQSTAINRLVGRLTGLYPDDLVQGALCDEAMEAVEDARHLLGPSFSMRDDEKKAAREALADGALRNHLGCLQARLAQRGGKYFADQRLTIADLSVFVLTRYITSGTLDHIPTDLPERAAPLLLEHHDAVKSHPKIAAYYASR